MIFNPYACGTVLVLLVLLYACEQKPKEEWPEVIMEECTDDRAIQLEKMKVRCQPASELEPEVYAAWRLQWCQDAPSKFDLSREQAKQWMMTCRRIYEKQMKNIQAIKEGRPIPYPPPTTAEVSKRLHDQCNKYIESRRKRGDGVENLGDCDGLLKEE